jgi:hypothetical protein
MGTYLRTLKDAPGEYTFRHAQDASRCLGAERIAKTVLEAMQTLGIDTAFFKAHALRGASASTALSNGVLPFMVQGRGGWRSAESFNQFYARAHQDISWEKVVYGATGAPGPVDAGFGEAGSLPVELGPLGSAAASSTGSERSEAEGGGSEGEPKAPAAPADAFADVTVPLGSKTRRNGCSNVITQQARFNCERCDRTFHVRCLAPQPSTAPTEAGRFFPWCSQCHPNERWRISKKAPGYLRASQHDLLRGELNAQTQPARKRAASPDESEEEPIAKRTRS